MCGNEQIDKAPLELLQPSPSPTVPPKTITQSSHYYLTTITITPCSSSVIKLGGPPWSCNQLHKPIPGDKPGETVERI